MLACLLTGFDIMGCDTYTTTHGGKVIVDQLIEKIEQENIEELVQLDIRADESNDCTELDLWYASKIEYHLVRLDITDCQEIEYEPSTLS